MENYYEILGVKQGASQEEIKLAYEHLYSKLNHENNGNQEIFNKEYNKLKRAYVELSILSILRSSENEFKSNIIAESSNSTNNTIKRTVVEDEVQDFNKIKNVKNIHSNISNSISSKFKTYCILSIIWSALLFFAFMLAFFGYFKNFKENSYQTNILIFSVILFCVPIYYSTYGVLLMINGILRGYKLFFYGNLFLILFLLLSFIKGGLNAVTVFVVFISIIFGIIFNYFKNELTVLKN